MTALSPRCSFSGTALKTIACITMLIDHIGASCIEAGILTPGLDSGTLSRDTLSAYSLYRLDMVLRFTGRLAFPLFCFLLVEGFVHTHNVKGYLGRLVLFGNGAAKSKTLFTEPGVHYVDVTPSARGLVKPATEALKIRKFEDVAYFEPFYLKNFVATSSSKKFF